MAYGILKCDTITFTNGGVDKSVSISGLVQNPTFSGNVTSTGTISGATITGNAGAFTTITGGVATITSGVFAVGSVTNPSISFSGDANTGIYSPAADTFAFVEGGVEALRIDSSGRVGIGTTSPSELLHVAGNARIGGADANTVYIEIGQGATGNRAAFIDLTGDTTYTDYGLRLTRENGGANTDSALVHRGTGSLRIEAQDAGGNIAFKLSGSERLRIDSSGRLLVGTSTSITTAIQPYLQVQGTGENAYINAGRWSSDANPPGLIFGKSRGGAVGTLGIVSSGDALGEISFYGDDGSAFRFGARILAEVDGTPGTSDMPGRLVFSTTADGASSPTERMRIGANANVKITQPNTNADGLTIDNTNGSFTSSAITITTARAAGTDCLLFYGLANAAQVIIIYNNGNIVNANNSYGAISDIKLKENIVDANSQWDDLKALQVRKYNLKEGQTHTQIGLVAQEVELVSPGLVTESPDRDEDGNDLGTITKSVNYSVLYMKAVKALQEAMTRIESLEAAVTALQQS